MTLISDEGVEIPRGQDTTIRVTLNPATNISAWTGPYTLKLREDPDYPRTTAQEKADAKSGDLDVDSWTAALTTTTATIVDAANGIIDFTLPRASVLALGIGTNRYVAAAWRVESGSTWQIWGPTWVSVVPSVYDNL